MIKCSKCGSEAVSAICMPTNVDGKRLNKVIYGCRDHIIDGENMNDDEKEKLYQELLSSPTVESIN